MTLDKFKPRKAKAGYRVRIGLDNLRMLADLQELLSEEGEAGEGKDYWLEIQREPTTTPDVFVVYANSQEVIMLLDRFTSTPH
jgi:hypothetical protein